MAVSVYVDEYTKVGKLTKDIETWKKVEKSATSQEQKRIAKEHIEKNTKAKAKLVRVLESGFANLSTYGKNKVGALLNRDNENKRFDNLSISILNEYLDSNKQIDPFTTNLSPEDPMWMKVMEGKTGIDYMSVVKSTIAVSAVSLLAQAGAFSTLASGLSALMAFNPVVGVCAIVLGSATLIRKARQLFAPEINKLLANEKVKQKFAEYSAETGEELNIDKYIPADKDDPSQPANTELNNLEIEREKIKNAAYESTLAGKPYIPQTNKNFSNEEMNSIVNEGKTMAQAVLAQQAEEKAKKEAEEDAARKQKGAEEKAARAKEQAEKEESEKIQNLKTELIAIDEEVTKLYNTIKDKVQEVVSARNEATSAASVKNKNKAQESKNEAERAQDIANEIKELTKVVRNLADKAQDNFEKFENVPDIKSRLDHIYFTEKLIYNESKKAGIHTSKAQESANEAMSEATQRSERAYRATVVKDLKNKITSILNENQIENPTADLFKTKVSNEKKSISSFDKLMNEFGEKLGDGAEETINKAIEDCIKQYNDPAKQATQQEVEQPKEEPSLADFYANISKAEKDEQTLNAYNEFMESYKEILEAISDGKQSMNNVEIKKVIEDAKNKALDSISDTMRCDCSILFEELSGLAEYSRRLLNGKPEKNGKDVIREQLESKGFTLDQLKEFGIEVEEKQ